MGRTKPKVLIVDNEKKISTALGRIFKKNKIEFVSCESGEAGIKELSETEVPFSLIISDQCLPGMTGAEFLEQAKERSPATIRFLISKNSDGNALINLINKGIAQKFIQQPWELNSLVDTVKKGFAQFKNTLENEKLEQLARGRNRKLYHLNSNLNEKVAGHKKAIEEFDRGIVRVKKEIEKIESEANIEEPLSIEYFEKLFKHHNKLESGELNLLFQDTVYELFEQFSAVAKKNGFEMPQID